MSDEISIGEKSYISSRRASELSGYTQDYIGQLARGGHIEAERIGGLWYVRMESLLSYKEKAEQYKPQPPLRTGVFTSDPESLISFDGKDYISAQRAAKITRYNQDYIGQLAREGKILSRMVGNRWYIERDALLTHKENKDALLAAVQAQSVGITREVAPAEASGAPGGHDMNVEHIMTYHHDTRPLMPFSSSGEEIDVTSGLTPPIISPESLAPRERIAEDVQASGTPQRIDLRQKGGMFHKPNRKTFSIPGNTRYIGLLGSVALTVVIVLSVGFLTLKDDSLYAVRGGGGGDAGVVQGNMLASANNALHALLDILETYLVPELVYRRG